MLSQQRSPLSEYRYDPLDRLSSHSQPNAPMHQRFYCKSRLATEIQGASRQSIFQHGDLLLAQQQRQDNSVDVALLATDQQRSVFQTLGKDYLSRPTAYAPYGHHRAESGLSSLLSFNGERADPITGHYLLGNGYRAFNPVLMRFNSPDSWSPFGRGGLNAYAYCGGDPVNQTDPAGHAPIIVVNRWSELLTACRGKPVTQLGHVVANSKTVDAIGTSQSTISNRFIAVNRNQEIAKSTNNIDPVSRTGELYGVYLTSEWEQNVTRTEVAYWIPPQDHDRLIFTKLKGAPPSGSGWRTEASAGSGPSGGGGGGGAPAPAAASVRTRRIPAPSASIAAAPPVHQEPQVGMFGMSELVSTSSVLPSRARNIRS